MTPAGMSEPDRTPIETIEYWADAYTTNPLLAGHGMVAMLLLEYANVRRRALTRPAAVPEPAAPTDAQFLALALKHPDDVSPLPTMRAAAVARGREAWERFCAAAPAAVREPAPDYHESTNAAWKTALGYPAVPPSEEKK